MNRPAAEARAVVLGVLSNEGPRTAYGICTGSTLDDDLIDAAIEGLVDDGEITRAVSGRYHLTAEYDPEETLDSYDAYVAPSKED